MATAPEYLTISSSKRKLAGLVLVSGTCAGFGVAWWMAAEASLLGTAVAAVCVGCLVLSALYGMLKICDRTPALVLDREGIIDNSTGVAAGRVRWEEITDVRFRTIGRQRFVTIDVVDARRFVELGGAAKRLIKRVNTATLGSPINIPTDGLAISPEALFRELEIFYAAYGRRRSPPGPADVAR
jgi:hypothetical protein